MARPRPVHPRLKASVGRKSEAPSAIFTGVLPCRMG
jgi:hypothetical protein